MVKDQKGNGKRFIVRQTRSSIGRPPGVGRTLRALGLGRIGREREHLVNDCMLGMLKKVEYLIEVRPLIESVD